MLIFFKQKNNKGFTLIESVVSSALLAIFASGLYMGYVSVMQVVDQTKLNAAIAKLTESEIEKIHNMPYEDIGVVGGTVPGTIPSTKTISLQGYNLEIKTYISSVDDPVDGLSPSDTNPTDYKYVQIDAQCKGCIGGSSVITLATQIAPKTSESLGTKGGLFIKVFDANGVPVSGVTVKVTNTLVSPSVNITDTTDSNGVLQLTKLATSTNYQISVSKAGYSSEQTYATSTNNPNPVNSPAIVIADTVTPISFTIDKYADLSLLTQTDQCMDLPSLPISVTSWKLIGTDPDVPKFSTTTLSGTLHKVEWGTYDLTTSSSTWTVIGSSEPLPLIMLPGQNKTVKLIFGVPNPSGILVRVSDANGNLINGATVTLTKGSDVKTAITGQKSWAENDWTNNNYSSITSGIALSSGAVKLASVSNKYTLVEQNLVSKTFDIGSSDNTFYNMSWTPTSQPNSTTIKFQVAGNNDNNTWNFVGPDGTSTSFFTTNNVDVSSVLNGNRYIRYKVFLLTTNTSNTPTLNSVTFTYNSSCMANGSAYFGGINNNGQYSLKIQKNGYTTYIDNQMQLGQTDLTTYNAILGQ